MTEIINCPQCNTENDFSASKCVNCGFNLRSNSSDSNSEPDWLSFLRDAEDEIRSVETNLSDPNENFSELNESSDEEAPDWKEN